MPCGGRGNKCRQGSERRYSDKDMDWRSVRDVEDEEVEMDGKEKEENVDEIVDVGVDVIVVEGDVVATEGDDDEAKNTSLMSVRSSVTQRMVPVSFWVCGLTLMGD